MTYAQAFAAYTGRSYAGNSAFFTGAYPTNIRHVCQVAAQGLPGLDYADLSAFIAAIGVAV